MCLFTRRTIKVLESRFGSENRRSLTGMSSGPEERRGVCTKWYQSLKKLEIVFCVLETVEIMLLRIHVDPPIVNRSIGREMRDLHARLEAMEAMQRRTHVTGDFNDAESKEIEVE